MMSATVTIAVPTRNRAALLQQLLESIAAQTFSDFEVIVCDNASEDDTPAVVRSFGEPFRIERSDVDIGFAPNHLRALECGSGRYLAVVQDDDLLDPSSLARKVAVLEANPDVTMVHSAFRIADAHLRPLHAVANWDGSPVDVIRPEHEFIARTFGDGRRSHVSASLYRRAAIERATMNERDAEVIELALSLRCALNGQVAFISDPLGTIRYHAQQNAVHTGVADAADAFERTFAQIALFKEGTDRFVDLFANRLPEPDRLRADAHRWIRFELRRQIVRRLPAHPAPGIASSLLREAARVDRTLLRDPRSLWVVANASLGTRGRERLAAMRSRPKRRSGVPRTVHGRS
jgi:glycosyltransferase involved in cell wall biosynthesis